ncbi:carbamoyltransferase HypF [Magnetovibrio blakemorei]|uniref:Carbamoyltransferase HypF n=1 Tax=Magnetovibrio blakemorei TaxID=28181 RepID=A0A1E5Q8A6_9PROT|nr:carbamoyltransferase HypF [Magnetovibrio blakemorei]OEJ67593.1 carbamoyltransferase HypF [Magnetovibrio blakemorei]
MTSPKLQRRVHVRVRGIVQGVGFRPFVNGLATRFMLGGWVLNDGDGVLLEVEGNPASVASFLKALGEEAPPLAHIDDVLVEDVDVVGKNGFEIRHSQKGLVGTSVPPDATVCDACLEELFDPNDRHYGYPFINCTHCGPRFTITRRLPYDRPSTSMAAFEMCAACAAEYSDPNDRRFHAQPVACPLCGPILSMEPAEIVRRLKAGEILAIKGLGGFHIVCDAHNEDVVVRLRERKNREEKPFAIMAVNSASLQKYAKLDVVAEAQLCSTARPIVIVPKCHSSDLAPSIAPGLAEIGVMLPYTPIHYLLFHAYAGQPPGTAWLDDLQDFALVMTSANPGGEPLVIGNEEAERRLDGIVDAIVSHDRDILLRTDDSVVRMIGAAPTFIRRARGYVPMALKLPHSVPSGLALGGHLKSTICVTRGDQAFVSQHIGDLDTPQGLIFFEETVHHMLSITEVRPQWLAHDLHPDFYATRFAQGLGDELSIPALGVQHHHAHVAAVVAEHGLEGPVLGLALDGFGLGEGGGEGEGPLNWGGEALLVNGAEYTRLGHLAPLPLPGGESAFRAPWRIGAAVLYQLGRGDEIEARYGHLGDMGASGLLKQMLERNVNVVPSTSCGRLFDAAAGLLNVQPIASFDGQAPMKLEALVTEVQVLKNGWQINGTTLDLSPLLAVLADLDPIVGANLFHGTLIEALADWAARLAETSGVKQIALSGGCLQNRVLAEGLERRLLSKGLSVRKPQALPPGDGGLSFGQAWVACCSVLS